MGERGDNSKQIPWTVWWQHSDTFQRKVLGLRHQQDGHRKLGTPHESRGESASGCLWRHLATPRGWWAGHPVTGRHTALEETRSEETTPPPLTVRRYLDDSREVSQVEQVVRFWRRWQETLNGFLEDVHSGGNNHLKWKKIGQCLTE